MAEPILIAGGGDFSKMPQQQVIIPEIHVEVVQPPPDNTMFIVTGIVVPVILAIFGWWVMHRKKAPAVTPGGIAPEPYAKTDAEK
jgi:hypothetical protein